MQVLRCFSKGKVTAKSVAHDHFMLADESREMYPRMTMKPLILLLAIASAALAEEKPRVWTNTEGKTITGTLKAKDAVNAEVMLANTSRVKLPLVKLSKADQDYVAAADVHPDVAMTAKTVSVQSNEKSSQNDKRAVEVTVTNSDGRPYSVVIKWLGPDGSSVGVYKSETKQVSADGAITFNVEYKHDKKSGDDYKGYAVALMLDGKPVLKRASQTVFERFLPE